MYKRQAIYNANVTLQGTELAWEQAAAESLEAYDDVQAWEAGLGFNTPYATAEEANAAFAEASALEGAEYTGFLIAQATAAEAETALASAQAVLEAAQADQAALAAEAVAAATAASVAAQAALAAEAAAAAAAAASLAVAT